ncbi:MAG: hypothetical protein ACK5L0_02095, partial [Candidatus Fimivivens sp.]
MRINRRLPHQRRAVAHEPRYNSRFAAIIPQVQCTQWYNCASIGGCRTSGEPLRMNPGIIAVCG